MRGGTTLDDDCAVRRRSGFKYQDRIRRMASVLAAADPRKSRWYSEYPGWVRAPRGAETSSSRKTKKAVENLGTAAETL